VKSICILYSKTILNVIKISNQINLTIYIYYHNNSTQSRVIKNLTWFEFQNNFEKEESNELKERKKI